MEKLKSVEELNIQLEAFETDVERSIGDALNKLGEKEGVSEFHFVPFDGNVAEYVLVIRLNSQRQPVFLNPKSKDSQQPLSQFMHKNSIGHRDLIELLKIIMLAVAEHRSVQADTDTGI